jgi:hypothetical protein
MHQSGVNCLDAVMLKTSEIFVVSGGDDQAVSVLHIPAGDWAAPKAPVNEATVTIFTNCHYSAVKGVSPSLICASRACRDSSVSFSCCCTSHAYAHRCLHTTQNHWQTRTHTHTHSYTHTHTRTHTRTHARTVTHIHAHSDPRPPGWRGHSAPPLLGLRPTPFRVVLGLGPAGCITASHGDASLQFLPDACATVRGDYALKFPFLVGGTDHPGSPGRGSA